MGYFLFVLRLHSQYKLLGTRIACQLTWSDTQVVYVTSVQFTKAAVARWLRSAIKWKKGVEDGIVEAVGSRRVMAVRSTKAKLRHKNKEGARGKAGATVKYFVLTNQKLP